MTNPLSQTTLLASKLGFFLPLSLPLLVLNTLVLNTIVSPGAIAQTTALTDEEPTPSLTRLLYGRDLRTPDSLYQVTSIDQLSDVQPSDWAFQALQSLVERYGCIAGYPDGTFRGNRALTRYEFAAGLNSCLDRIGELIAQSTADLATKEDTAIIQRLQSEFAEDLASLRGRVDSLEARTAELEANQFSTTTQLRGEAIFSVSDTFGQAVGDDSQTVLQNRVQLDLNTSFTGRDRLRTRLESANIPAAPSEAPFSFFSEQTRLAYATDTENRIELAKLDYTFPLNDAISLYIGASGSEIRDILPSINPTDDEGNGALSYFSYNPIYDIVTDGAAIGANIKLSDSIDLDLGYLASEASQPTAGAGLFNGNYAAFGQLTVTPSDRLRFGITYIHAYTDEPAIVFNAYGLQANYRVTPGFELGGWVGYVDNRAFAGTPLLSDGRSWTYAATLLFPDLGKDGNLLGFIIGVPPRLADIELAGEDNEFWEAILQEDAALHIEGFYRFQVNDNISITPGIIWVGDRGNRNENPDIVIGALRTTFRF